MKAWLSPEGKSVDLLESVPARQAALLAVHESGARFLALPVRDVRDAAEWALACFHSPIVFVPLPANLPAPALEKRLRQLPPGVVFPEDLPKNARPPKNAPKLREGNDIWAVIFSSDRKSTRLNSSH